MLPDLIANADRINAFTHYLETYPIHTESRSQVVGGRSAPSIDLNVGDNALRAMTGRWTQIDYKKRTTTYDHFENRIIYGVSLRLRKALDDLAAKRSLQALALYSYLRESREFLDRFVSRPEFRDVNVQRITTAEIEFYHRRRFNVERRQAFFMAIDLFFELPSVIATIDRMV